MTQEEIFASIESDDVKEAIAELINAEKQKGISKYSAKDKEVLKWKNVAKDLGWDSEKFEDTNTFVESFKDTSEKAKKSKGTITSLQEQLDDMKLDLAKERDLVAREKQTSRDNKLRAKLTSEIGADFYGSKYLINEMISDNTVDFDGDDIVFKFGDDTLGFEAGVIKLKETNKDMLRLSQKRGSGDKGGDEADGDEPSFTDLLKKQMKV